jgi:hypothetical protein
LSPAGRYLQELLSRWLSQRTLGGIRMLTKKDRRHSGYVSPKSTVSQKDLKKYDLLIDEHYNEWENYRDSFRDQFRDFKTIKKINRLSCSYNEDTILKRLRMNKKQKKLLARRLLRKKKR